MVGIWQRCHLTTAAAQRATSAGFSQGQRVVIVTDPDRRRRLAEMAGEAIYTGEGFDPWISEALALFVPRTPLGVIPIGRPLPDKKSPSLRRGWRGFDEFTRWETR